jgi:hypothetical protein
MLQKTITILLFLLLPFMGIVTRVKADEIVISGNGSQSSSVVSAAVNTETTITQNNEANITNNINITANTGGNTANNNNGDQTSITTGSVNVDTNITNSANSSSITTDCCPSQNNQITISNNADGSQNVVNLGLDTTTNVTINQVAQIANNIGVNANTGFNSANYNSGDTAIETGNVSVFTNIKNKGINNTYVNVPGGMVDFFNIKISDNGINSINLINYNVNNEFLVLINNLASISNVLDINANSGGNTADFNNGDTKIKTGDVYIATSIDNIDINKSIVKIECCPKEVEPTPPPSGGNPPETPCTSNCNPSTPCTSNCSPTSSSSGGGGEVLGATTSGNILPATGSYWIVILTIVSLLMFLTGLYLRRHPGQDPGKVALA